MADTVDRILMRYQSQNFEDVVKEQQRLAASYEKSAKAQDKVNASASKLEGRLGKLSSFGRNLRQAGGFLGNDTIAALGDFADGISDVGDSINAVVKNGGGLGKVVAGLGAAIGGITVGAGIYDATIGKLQGGNTAGNILGQFGKFAQAGFNQETLRNNMASELNEMSFKIAAAKIEAQMVEVNYQKSLADKSQQNVLRDAVVYGAMSLFGVGGGGRSAAAVGELINRPKREATLNYFSNVASGAQSSIGFINAGRTFQQRTRGASNMYSSALLAIDQETGQKRAEITRNYSRTLLQLDQEYYANRQKLAAQYGTETARLEADHQKDIRRLQEDHQGRLKKLIESRDALAVEDEIDSYNKERQRSEEDYAEMMQERQADYAAQLRELEAAHREQRNERARAFNEEIYDLQVQAQYRRQQEAVQYNLLLQDILKAFTDARNTWAAQVNNSTTVTNNNKNANVTNNINTSATTEQIQNAVYGALVGAFG